MKSLYGADLKSKPLKYLKMEFLKRTQPNKTLLSWVIYFETGRVNGYTFEFI